MTAAAFNELLHLLGIQYKVGGTWVLYNRYDDLGFTASRTYYKPNRKAIVHTVWTQVGRAFIYEVLKNYGMLPEAERLRLNAE